MKILAIIPVRMGSSRFPGKPLARIKGKTMTQIIYQNVKLSKHIDDVYVATCDKVIFDHVKKFGGKVVMTSLKHKRATDRTAEALKKIEIKNGSIKYDVVVMVQGDEPMVDSKMIDLSIKPFKNKNVNVVNLISAIKNRKLFDDVNCVKVVKNKKNKALYFSRLPIPYSMNKKNIKKKIGFKQVCIIPFRRNFLIKYLNMKPTTYEINESVDMMRIIENGFDVNLVETKKETFPVDTKLDLKKVRKYF